MKKFFLLVLLFSNSISTHSLSRLDSLTMERNKVFQKYLEHKDTMTVNTWLNIFKLNKYLQQIVNYDSVIKNEIIANSVNNNTSLSVIQSKVENLINEKKDLNRRLSEIDSVRENSDKQLKISAFAGAIVIVLLVLFFSLYIVTLNKIKAKNTSVKEYHTQLYSAKAEIDQLQKDQMEMASEINIQKESLNNEVKRITEKMSLLMDEKVLLENQMIEIKKAYDREVERRIIVEDKLHSMEAPVINSFEEKIQNILPDGEKSLVEDIQLLKIKLEHEKSIRLSIENELNKLLHKLREQYT